MSDTDTIEMIHEDALPGHESALEPKPDWEPRYPGSGRLQDKVAVITGADSGIGRAVAAVPGRVTSPLSAGTNALLAQGAHLLRDPADALELLPAGGPYGSCRAGRPAARRLEPRLQRILDRVRAGTDSPDRLRREAGDVGELLCALTELELMGLLARGDGGRYVPLDPQPVARRASPP